ncbi:MAG TPA: hypothetical protein VFK31_09130 [Rhodanobacteraceae bacterium]|nr:hypothetical protein [Rhodanobacteraceae bacterium]
MSTRKLVSMAASVLITGATMMALVTTGPAPLPQPSTIDGLPVTNLPGITVTARVKPDARRHARHPAKRSVTPTNGSSSSLHDAAPQLAMPHLRMPYYSFGSVSVQINKD